MILCRDAANGPHTWPGIARHAARIPTRYHPRCMTSFLMKKSSSRRRNPLEVLVDEVIEGISCSVIREMPIEQGAVRVLVGWELSQRARTANPPCRRRVKNPPNCLRVEIDLLPPF